MAMSFLVHVLGSVSLFSAVVLMDVPSNSGTCSPFAHVSDVAAC